MNDLILIISFIYSILFIIIIAHEICLFFNKILKTNNTEKLILQKILNRNFNND